MQTIWKYVLQIRENNTISMPKDATFLHAAEQNGEVYVWVRVDPDRPKVNRHIAIYGTGHPIPTRFQQYVGTAHIKIQSQPELVWHIFDLGEF